VTVDAKALYQELILEHGKHPRHEGPLAGATHEATETNPLCGDRVTVRVRVEDGVVREACFEARGCMIARASASILVDTITGRTVADATALEATLQALAAAKAPPADAGPLEPLRGVREFPARVRCATLAWSCLARALGRSNG
jgi:nitrogen fixation NifU-like protein